mmetsp:Transcript_18560/g.70198  ORF Transcript_18560/g.70198 Transcript_18560/m.70198 type:complete len:213 (-) Transcript_18560:537-1175(-)
MQWDHADDRWHRVRGRCHLQRSPRGEPGVRGGPHAVFRGPACQKMAPKDGERAANTRTRGVSRWIFARHGPFALRARGRTVSTAHGGVGSGAWTGRSSGIFRRVQRNRGCGCLQSVRALEWHSEGLGGKGVPRDRPSRGQPKHRPGRHAAALQVPGVPRELQSATRRACTHGGGGRLPLDGREEASAADLVRNHRLQRRQGGHSAGDGPETR